MRKNILLDFLSPDNWKTYATVPKDILRSEKDIRPFVSLLRQSINVAVLLTPEYCLLPPAFIVQSPVAFRAVYESSLYLDEGKIYLPLRETDIDRYITKKMQEYWKVRGSHSGFYTEEHWNFLYQYRRLLIPRSAAMGITIARQWLTVSDHSKIWKPIVSFDPKTADLLRDVPMRLKERGESVTLEAIIAESKQNDPDLARYINQAIQHEYLKAYVMEYDVSILSNAPPKPLFENYLIPIESCYYNFNLFINVLKLLGIKEYFLTARPETILEFRKQPEYDTLINIYSKICENQRTVEGVEWRFKQLIAKTGKNMGPIAGVIPLLAKNIVRSRINRIADIFEEPDGRSFSAYKKVKGNSMKEIVILVTTPTEYKAVMGQFEEKGYIAENDNIEDLFFKRIVFYNGVKIYLVQTEMGVAQVGGAFNTTHTIIELLQPDAIIICGICFGIESSKESLKMCDILVSTEIWDYETSKISAHAVEHRGQSIPTSRTLIQLFRRASYDFKIPVHFGLMGAGDKNVNDESFIKELVKVQPRMIGGDMEGVGVVSACQAKRTDCLLVKAICDWGHDKGDGDQMQAANNSAAFVITALESMSPQ